MARDEGGEEQERTRCTLISLANRKAKILEW